MRNVLIQCDHAMALLPSDQFDLVQPVNQFAPNWNMRLEAWHVSHYLLHSLNPLAHDLLDIAAFVYYADNSVSRGSVRDLFHESWVRRFTFVVPVRRPEIWRQQSVVTTLVEMLEFLTEDRFEFVFTQRAAMLEQLAFQQIGEELPPCPEVDCVTLFSGGMDSLAGAVQLCSEGRKPLLVSHQSRTVLARLQHDLALPLRQRLPSWEFPHIGVWINRKGQRATENSQRSRSFLYLALGSLLAYEIGLNELVVCENGITTFNFPRLGQVTGAHATRSTHPRFIQLFRQLVSEVFESDFRIDTPFIWSTRAEVIEILKQNDCADLLPLSVSCAQSRRPKIHPHCGICSQCVDRRFAVTHGRLDTPTELNLYEKDIFTAALNEGQETAQVVSAVQFALDVRQRSLDSFCEHYVEVFDAINSLPGDPEEALEEIYRLHRRYADEVIGVMRMMQGNNWERLVNRELPDTCLLMLVNPASPRRPNWMIVSRAEELIKKLLECPVSESKPLEDLCEEVLDFLFCEDLSIEYALNKPEPQSKSDQGYERRDLLFENRATEGFWADARREYDAVGVVFDAKNYQNEITGDTVRGFSSKYLKKHGVGRLGVIVARKVPPDTLAAASTQDRVSSAVKVQKDQWSDDQKMVVLLGEEDLIQMLKMKANGQDPTNLIRDRIFTLRSRI
jgi:7-cyano-7-deazaguanine synthase in queuosine biosynthesis